MSNSSYPESHRHKAASFAHGCKLDLEQTKLLSFKILSFLRALLEELDAFGFVGIEYLEKAELFTRSVMITYPKKDFAGLLNAMLEINPKFYQTKFFMGLVALRRTCALEFNHNLPGLENIPKGILPEIASGAELNYDVIFFITHLMLNVSRFINQIRHDDDLKELSTKQLKYRITNSFPDIATHTLTSIQAGHS